MPADGRQVEFSSAARARIPPALLDEIRARSPLDAELYRMAKALLEHKRAALREAGLLRPLAPATDELRRVAAERRAAAGRGGKGGGAGGGGQAQAQGQQQQQQQQPEQQAGFFQRPAGRDEHEL